MVDVFAGLRLTMAVFWLFVVYGLVVPFAVTWVVVTMKRGRKVSAAADAAGGRPIATLKADADALVVIRPAFTSSRDGWSGASLWLVQGGESEGVTPERVWSLAEGRALRWHVDLDGAAGNVGYKDFASYVRAQPVAHESVVAALESWEQRRLLRNVLVLVAISAPSVVYSFLGGGVIYK